MFITGDQEFRTRIEAWGRDLLLGSNTEAGGEQGLAPELLPEWAESASVEVEHPFIDVTFMSALIRRPSDGWAIALTQSVELELTDVVEIGGHPVLGVSIGPVQFYTEWPDEVVESWHGLAEISTMFRHAADLMQDIQVPIEPPHLVDAP